ncbi:hypothetical protein CA850_29615 [Micromonospora echinospora]|uniref:Uncharacterized protein n=1 Tax=Micromonospora echinospora TaxID=1877 RepID=A0A1C4U4I5_MICEC|nr:hypothetical protein [Micromonospora echinospora]OZV74738.1 hypothetical protein CA850_29615 [Micromonospora echinospora]SCE66615.1 hypothetical protein GA0070618_0010 [Micromonospora echinospora]SCF42572.1 hypothetical protein GA0070618_6680 [Micromonospora echinospora]
METTTVGKLTVGARVLVTMDPHAPTAFASDPATARAAEVVAEPEKVGRRRLIRTDLGDIEAGPTTKVVLAPAEPEQTPETAPEPAEDAVPAPAGLVTATATVDAAGRLTAESVVRVGGAKAPVPTEVDGPAGKIAPVRLVAALAALGYEPVGRWAPGAGNYVECQVRPLHP